MEKFRLHFVHQVKELPLVNVQVSVFLRLQRHFTPRRAYFGSSRRPTMFDIVVKVSFASGMI